MKKRKLIFNKMLMFGFILMFLFISFNTTVNADMGPKPSIHIKITGIEGDYVVAFAATNAYGPNFDYESYSEMIENNEGYYFLQEYNPIMEYYDNEGFKWITHYSICNGEDEVSFTYYRPEIFKLVIYKNDELYKVTDAIDCYAFNSYYKMDFSNEKIKIYNTYQYHIEILKLLFRIVLTLAIEVGLFLLFKLYTKRNLLVFIFVNIITQIGMNICLNITSYFNGGLYAIFLLFICEVVIILLEPILYLIFMKEKNKWIIILYGIIANILSFVLGLIILLYIM